jgi:hypothetical protein
VNETSRAVAATILGGVIGCVFGYLFLTEKGRALRRQHIEPALEDVARELSSFRATLEKAAGIATEGWKLFGEALGESDERSPRYGNPHQTAPF